MACFSTYSNNNDDYNSTNGSIAQLLSKIDQLQKEAIIANATNQCDNCMMSAMYNTKPIAIYFCCDGTRFSVEIEETDTTANLFRVEEVRNNETVVLRLLTTDDAGDIVCTTFTIVLNISCIGAVQCFAPINCETLCTQTL